MRWDPFNHKKVDQLTERLEYTEQWWRAARDCERALLDTNADLTELCESLKRQIVVQNELLRLGKRENTGNAVFVEQCGDVWQAAVCKALGLTEGPPLTPQRTAELIFELKEKCKTNLS